MIIKRRLKIKVIRRIIQIVMMIKKLYQRRGLKSLIVPLIRLIEVEARIAQVRKINPVQKGLKIIKNLGKKINLRNLKSHQAARMRKMKTIKNRKVMMKQNIASNTIKKVIRDPKKKYQLTIRK